MSSRRSRRGLTKRPHPWPPQDNRYLPQTMESWVKAVLLPRSSFATMRDDEYHMPIPQTYDECLKAGLVFIGDPK